MRFVNETELPAYLFRSEFEPDQMYDSLLARIRCRIGGAAPERGSFNRACPELSQKQLASGHEVRLRGMSPDGEVRFVLPCCPLQVEVRLGMGGLLGPRQEHGEASLDR